MEDRMLALKTETQLLALAQGHSQPRRCMPAKSCSWKFEGPDGSPSGEKEAVACRIYYNGVIAGRMALNAEGEWVGHMHCVVDDDGIIRDIAGQSDEGMPDSKTCGCQIWHKFRRSVSAAGLAMPW
jgi:hypothetical protein